MIPANLFSCGPSLETDETRLALFRTGLDSRTTLSEFYYSESFLGPSMTSNDSIDKERNCKEWAAFTKQKARVKDIYAIQYQTSFSDLENAINEKDTILSRNSFVQWLKASSNTPALDYMLLAKENEYPDMHEFNPWDTIPFTLTPVAAHVVQTAINKIAETKSSFLKQRYAFQAIKALHYNRRKGYTDTLLCKLYEDNLATGNTLVAAWAKVYYALQQTDPAKRTLFFLKCFDECEEKKRFCFQNINIYDLDTLQKINKEPHIQSLISVMKALKNKGRATEEIKHTIKYEPQSKYLPTLITREVNKLENWIWSPEILLFDPNYQGGLPEDERKVYKKIRQQDREYLTKFRSYMQSIPRQKGVAKDILTLALIHLYNMENNTTAAENVLNSLPVNKNPLLETQRLTEKIITAALSGNIIGLKAQNNLANYITGLKTLNPVMAKSQNKGYYEQEDHTENNDDLSELYILLSNAYKKIGDNLTAGLLYTKPQNITVNNYDSRGYTPPGMYSYQYIAWYDRNADASDVAALLRLKKQKKLTDFQKLIIPDQWPDDDVYKDLQGTILFRDKKYTEALKVFNSMNPMYWENNESFKYYLPERLIAFTGNWVSSSKDTAKYSLKSKALITADIVAIEHALNSAKTDSAKAIYYYALGNAALNTTFHGNAWMMYSYGKSAYESWESGDYRWADYGFISSQKEHSNDYYRGKNAAALYQKGYSLARDKETAAKCLLGLTGCRQMDYSYAGKRSYLPMLKAEYASTQSFKEAAIVCPDILGNYQ